MANELVPESAEDASTDRQNRRLLVALGIAGFLASLNFFAVSPFYPEMADDLDTTVPLLGQVTTMMILISAGLGLVIGPLSDRYGQRKPLVIGVVAVAINLIGMGLSTSYPMLLALSITGGLADAMVFNLPFAIIGRRLAGAAQRKAMSVTFAAISIAPIVGIPILTTIGDFTGWRIALVVGGIAALSSAWFVWSSIPPDLSQSSAPFRLREIAEAYRPLLRDKAILRLYGATVTRAMCWLGAVTYLGAFLSDELDLKTRTIGFIYMLSGLGFASGSMIGARSTAISGRLLVAVSSVLSAAAVGALFIFPSLWLSITLIYVVSALSSFAGIGLTSLLAKDSQAAAGTTMVLNGSMLNLGSAMGTALAGVLLGLSGYVAIGIALPIFSLIAAILAIWPHRSATFAH